MKNFIQVPVEEIKNTPNDMDLGGKIREIYWKQHSNVPNMMVCKICGKDTNYMDIDYLVGTDHLYCHLKKEE